MRMLKSLFAKDNKISKIVNVGDMYIYINIFETKSKICQWRKKPKIVNVYPNGYTPSQR